ncbi:MAG: hypothetical protein IT204_06335 [Fimbriimonadaceae bacterium]|nr:hypothetical protein [Fimbriimonadaceae bacterium]
MNDLRQRIEELPDGLRNGAWTHCGVVLRGSRVHFTELPGDTAQRRRLALRRRARFALLGVVLLVWAALAAGPGRQTALGIAGSLALLAAIEGLRRDLPARQRPHLYAVIDHRRQEVSLRRPDASGLTIPLADIAMFLVVNDPRRRLFHLGVVVQEVVFLPWLHTRSGFPATALTWLLAHLSDKPAKALVTTLPVLPFEIAGAQDLPTEPPTPL